VYVSPEFEQQKTQIQDESELFNEQLNINELFKLFDNSNNISSGSNVDNNNNNNYNSNNITYPSSHQAKSLILNSSKNTINDDEAKILITFKVSKFHIAYCMHIRMQIIIIYSGIQFFYLFISIARKD
jgi:chromosome condensin MukBEF MukE localization factor